jgi:hypothetical protein
MSPVMGGGIFKPTSFLKRGSLILSVDLVQRYGLIYVSAVFGANWYLGYKVRGLMLKKYAMMIKEE